MTDTEQQRVAPSEDVERPVGDHLGDAITIELTPAQLAHIAGAGAETNHMLLGLTRIVDPAAVVARASKKPHTRGSRSLLFGLLILAALPPDGSTASVTKLARDLGLSASTAHRYMLTLVDVGLVERDARTRRYRLLHPRAAPGAEICQ